MFPFPFSFFGAAADVPLELIDNNFAMEFDATIGQYLSAPNSMSALTGLSVSVWVYPTAVGTAAAEAMISTDIAASAPRGFYLALYASNKVRWQIGTTVYNSKNSLDVNNTLNLNQWNHVVGTWNATTMSVYINGSLAGDEPSGVANGTFNTTNDILIGTRETTGGYFPGSIDEVAVWSKTLQLEDVQTIYNATNDNPGKCANLFTAGLGTDLVFWNRMGD